MIGVKKFNILVLVIMFVFSIWFFGKSFGYDDVSHTFWVARHQVGDFGLHLALTRSVSYGANFPMELPFYPGKPLAYHYGFDLLAGLLERTGARLDIAINGLSIVAMVFFLFGIYALGRSVFGIGQISAAITSVLSVVGGGFAAFVSFVGSTTFETSLKDLWKVPDYIFKGPFDGSDILIFFTPNVLLNQRHLVVALAIAVWVLYFLTKANNKREALTLQVILIGVLLGISLYFHSLIFLATCFVCAFACIHKKRWKTLVYVFLPAFIFSYPQISVIVRNLTTGVSHSWIRLGFLTPEPVTAIGIIQFWWNNLGLTIVTVPIGLWLATKKQRVFFLPFALLFIVSNFFQFSFRVDHNHSIFNYIFVIGNYFTVIMLISLWKRGLVGRTAAVIVFLSVISSGVVHLMAVKNDFRYPLPELTSRFSAWARNKTPVGSIFLSYPDIIDPVALAGRFTYVGSSYYLDVLGYSYVKRRNIAGEFFASDLATQFDRMRKEGIDYVLVPKVPKPDYPYAGRELFFSEYLKHAYEDELYMVLSL